MGNWRRVQIVGHCSRNDIIALSKALDPGKDFENYHCLVNGGLCGLPMWATESINAVGNLAERNYTPKDVAEQLKELALIAPSLSVKIHCGDNYESETCVSTVKLDDGKVEIMPPEIEKIPEIPEAQIAANFIEQLMAQ